ncbi:type II toxin-antitoxin system RelE/ParE family toxin [Asticcacaulis sp. BYS171W]|uniref:Type II toxin-antitoxin system RelE/ParE family toxin n=1 Tax=Asticcacaulis aquaticus TaxID=2984212 RepID=A0ABT5HQ73_9CAUL|nr:type II toxin-antitoxin system RelE/ParE family toxin [Asticcacaulis aquaticus]MDC7681965.1 type II toxin-antitoxin system RelE/ParE family toxin [Asticcacaulis aquaticus]
MKVVFSKSAEDELEAIADYIALDSNRRAASFINELIDAALALGNMPFAFRLVPNFENAGIRRKPYKRYVIFYRVEDDKIVVIHILNSAQDHEALLSSDA